MSIDFNIASLKQGDALIRRGKYSARVKLVEGNDETGLLLVDGIKDEFYESEEYDEVKELYEVFCYYEDRHDI